MGEIRKSAKKKTAAVVEDAANPLKPAKPLGRKRDLNRDQDFLEATLNILAEVGFDSMTMDLVAARVKAGKATLYRRWQSKELLVRDALISMSRNSIEVDQLPDTGNVRDDLLSVVKPHSMEYSERKLKILAGLGSFTTQHQKSYDDALAGIFGPWIEVNTALMKRAVRRKELPKGADIAAACEVIVSMTAFRTSIQRKSFDRTSYETLLDNILIPGLKAGKR
jgi:AcrR family transcriptional regulator